MLIRALLVTSFLGACAAPAASPPAPPVAPPPVEAVPATTLPTTVQAAGLTFTVSARPFANLAYHLDCLSGEVHCADGAFHAYWDEGWTPADAAALAEWKHVRDAYEVSATLPSVVAPTPLPLPDASLDFDARLRMASIVSVTFDDYRQNLRVLLPPIDAERIARAAEHFGPRFEVFWKASGEGVAARFRAGLLAMLQHGELPAILARAARFYASPLGEGSPIDFDLIVLPSLSKRSTGEQVMGHGLIEVGSDETPEQRIDVVCHELFHYFYGTRSPEQQAALMAHVLETKDPLAVVAYALLDESVATALGNGVVDHAMNPPDYARRLAREQGFYTVHSIDATAKGLLSRTHEDPTTGPPLDSPEIVAALVAATRDAVGAEPSPIEYLHTFAGAADDGWWSTAMKPTTTRAHSNNVYRTTPFDSPEAVTSAKSHPLIPLVLVVPRARVSALDAYAGVLSAEGRRTVVRESKKPGGFAYAERRGASAWSFVIVADAASDAARVSEAFFAEHAVKAGVFRPN